MKSFSHPYICLDWMAETCFWQILVHRPPLYLVRPMDPTKIIQLNMSVPQTDNFSLVSNFIYLLRKPNLLEYHCRGYVWQLIVYG